MDTFWFRSIEFGTDTIDKFGRPLPDLKRWPSSLNGVGFKSVADQVHNLGLKFGIHILGGISQHAIDQKTLILDTSTVHISHFLISEKKNNFLVIKF